MSGAVYNIDSWHELLLRKPFVVNEWYMLMSLLWLWCQAGLLAFLDIHWLCLRNAQ